MGKIVDEIIENIPELEKDKDVLSKTVSFLTTNKPDIKINKTFKGALKNRINGLISIKTGRKNRFSFFAIPVFSFLFVVGGFLYYFKDIDFLIGGKDIPIEMIPEKSIKIKEIDEIGKIIEDELKTVLEEESIFNDKDNDFNQEKIESNSINEVESNEFEDNITVSNVNLVENNSYLDTSEDEDYTMLIEKHLAEESIEDNQLIDMFGGGEIEEESFNGINGFGVSESVIHDGFLESESRLSKELIIGDFSDYCESIFGELTGTGELEKCILDEKECLSSTFENGACEFVEKE